MAREMYHTGCRRSVSRWERPGLGRTGSPIADVLVDPRRRPAHTPRPPRIERATERATPGNHAVPERGASLRQRRFEKLGRSGRDLDALPDRLLGGFVEDIGKEMQHLVMGASVFAAPNPARAARARYWERE